METLLNNGFIALGLVYLVLLVFPRAWQLVIAIRSKAVCLRVIQSDIQYRGMPTLFRFKELIQERGFVWHPKAVGDSVVIRTRGSLITRNVADGQPYDAEYTLTYNGRLTRTFHSVTQKVTGVGDHVDPKHLYLYYTTTRVLSVEHIWEQLKRTLRRHLMYIGLSAGMFSSAHALPYQLSESGCAAYTVRVEYVVNRFTLGLPVVVSLPGENAHSDAIDAYKRVRYDLPGIMQQLNDGIPPERVVSGHQQRCLGT